MVLVDDSKSNFDYLSDSISFELWMDYDLNYILSGDSSP